VTVHLLDWLAITGFGQILMRLVVSPLILSLGLAVARCSAAGETPRPTSEVHLKIDQGIPLRVYVTKRISVRLNEPVQGRLLEPVYSFDRIVIPEGSEVAGRVIRLDPESRVRRISNMLNGDFTPQHAAEVQFERLTLPNGEQFLINAAASRGLPLVISASASRKADKANAPASKGAEEGSPGLKTTARNAAAGAIHKQINARTYGMADILRGPGKLERLKEFLVMKLPYHPQWVRKGTRYDAVLAQPLDFGTATVKGEDLKWIGSELPPGVHAQARLLGPLNSKTAAQGNRFEAKLLQPLFSPEHHLLLPEGTALQGLVTQARGARLFHRGGQLRFRFDNVLLPDLKLNTEAQIDAVEGNSEANLKVDQEGGVKATESKTRLLRPVIAGLIAAKSMDNDEGKAQPDSNYGGRTLGGGSGFGLAGALAAQSSRYVASALGFYGLAWSVYRNVIARGQEVAFQTNTALDVRFGSRGAKRAEKTALTKRIERSAR
jgi:hypothetical protein